VGPNGTTATNTNSRILTPPTGGRRVRVVCRNCELEQNSSEKCRRCGSPNLIRIAAVTIGDVGTPGSRLQLQCAPTPDKPPKDPSFDPLLHRDGIVTVIQLLRKKYLWSTHTLSKAVGLSDTFIRQLEKGTAYLNSKLSVEQFAKALKVSPGDFIQLVKLVESGHRADALRRIHTMPSGR
jgi:ribosome-binding protein aMBF1 (putative translation factor)